MDDTTMVAEILDLNRSVEKVADSLEVVKIGQEGMASDISKIKEAVYDPDQGIYARIKLLEAQINELKSWKSSQSKLAWIMVTSLFGLALTTLWANFLTGG
tara:strand:- start:134 stop:436 length:303 start_codon:yes stop_codon:yes gene_type:complete